MSSITQILSLANPCWSSDPQSIKRHTHKQLNYNVHAKRYNNERTNLKLHAVKKTESLQAIILVLLNQIFLPWYHQSSEESTSIFLLLFLFFVWNAYNRFLICSPSYNYGKKNSNSQNHKSRNMISRRTTQKSTSRIRVHKPEV